MAKNIKINGVTYNGVNDVEIPLSVGGGTAKFMETSDATANADDVAVGATAYSKGAKVVGTLDISGKADKVSGATNDNLASLDGSGNLKDSGSKAGDFEVTGAVSAHNSSNSAHSALFNNKADKVTGAINGNFAGLNTGGNLVDSGKAAADFVENRALESTNRGTDSSKFTCIMKLTAEVNQRACATVNLMQGSARGTIGILSVNCHHSSSGGMEVTAYWVFKPSPTIEAYYTITDAIDVRIYIEYVNTYSRVYFAPIAPPLGDVVFYETWGIVASVAGTTQIGFMPVPPEAIDGALPITKGGTGAVTAALARNALGLGNTTGALPIANGGTGSTTAANARTALGIRTFSGNCIILVSGRNYGEVTITGVTASSVITGVVASSQAATGWSINSIIAGSAKATIYFNQNSTTANQNISVKLIAIG